MEFLCNGYRDSKKPIKSENSTRQARILPDLLGDSSNLLGFFLCPNLVDVVRVLPDPTQLKLMVGEKNPFKIKLDTHGAKCLGMKRGKVRFQSTCPMAIPNQIYFYCLVLHYIALSLAIKMDTTGARGVFLTWELYLYVYFILFFENTYTHTHNMKFNTKMCHKLYLKIVVTFRSVTSYVLHCYTRHTF